MSLSCPVCGTHDEGSPLIKSRWSVWFRCEACHAFWQGSLLSLLGRRLMEPFRADRPVRADAPAPALMEEADERAASTRTPFVDSTLDTWLGGLEGRLAAGESDGRARARSDLDTWVARVEEHLAEGEPATSPAAPGASPALEARISQDRASPPGQNAVTAWLDQVDTPAAPDRPMAADTAASVAAGWGVPTEPHGVTRQEEPAPASAPLVTPPERSDPRTADLGAAIDRALAGLVTMTAGLMRLEEVVTRMDGRTGLSRRPAP